MTLPFQTQQQDFASYLLGAYELRAVEDEFRTVLADLKAQAPDDAVYPLAFLAAVMGAGGARWVHVWRILSYLKSQPLALLKEQAVAFINGTHWLVPSGEGVTILSASDMQPVDTCPPAMVATVYHLREMFNSIDKARESFNKGNKE